MTSAPRRKLVSDGVLAAFRKVMPPMSQTEREALEAGTVWWDGELFTGKPDWSKLLGTRPAQLSAEEQAFLDGPVETHVETAQGWRIDRYGDGGAVALEDRWHLVPQAVWHKSNAPGPGDCTVVALHTAREVADEYRGRQG